MQHTDFLDTKCLTSKAVKYIKFDTFGNRVNWLKLKWIGVTQGEQTKIHINYDFDQEALTQISILGKSTRHHCVTHDTMHTTDAESLYHSR